MDVPFLLSEAQMRRIEPFFPLSHGIPRVDDRRIVSGIIYVIKHGLMWRDAPKAYGPHKTIYNRFIRWSRMGVFNRIFAELAGRAGEPNRIMIDATHLKAHSPPPHWNSQRLCAMTHKLHQGSQCLPRTSWRNHPPQPSHATSPMNGWI